MSLFDVVDFDASDVKAVANGTGTRSQIMAIFTSQTCGEACWHARDEICRCSCGGKNHGCLSHGGAQPERTCRIAGERYKLAGVGHWRDLLDEAKAINKAAGWKSVEKATLQTDYEGKQWWNQYRYYWTETEQGAPARLKSASDSQRNWAELSGWKDSNLGVYLLWQRIQMPAKPTILVVDRITGQPLADQTPN